jgi:signal transduction histidine kinase
MIPLRTSHVVFYSLVVTLTFTLALAFGFWFIRRQMLTGNDFLLDAESREILARISIIAPPLDASKLKTAFEEEIEENNTMFYFEVNDPSGRVIYHSPNLGGVTLNDFASGTDKRTFDVPPLGLLRVAEYRTTAAQVQIAMSLGNFQSVNDTFVRVFLLGIPLIALLSVAFGVALRKSTLHPVQQMQATARRINASNLSERLEVPSGSGEMAALARLLNEMFDRLEKSFNHVKQISADTSHELMTPLSVIRLHAEKLLNDPELPSRYHHAVEEQLHETLHLADTLERLLMLAKADSMVLPLKLKPVVLQDFIRQFAEDAQLLAEKRGLKFMLAQNDKGNAVVDQGLMRQVLFNLLSNALRYNPPDGTITLRSCCGDGHWKLEVQDEGPGVPADRLEDIFGRFVQIAPRSEPGSGTGLGLAICKSIVELHKGKITAANRADRSGFVIWFQIPLDA